MNLPLFRNHQIPGLEGAAVTTAAFQAGLPFLPPEVVSFVLMACLVLFGFTVVVGLWMVYVGVKNG